MVEHIRQAVAEGLSTYPKEHSSHTLADEQDSQNFIEEWHKLHVAVVVK